MRVLVLVVTILSIWFDLAAAEQSEAQSKATPGTVALMVEPKTSADVLLLGTVIGDPDPAVRAVAARVAGLLSRTSVAAPLQELLDREQDVTAAVEQVERCSICAVWISCPKSPPPRRAMAPLCVQRLTNGLPEIFRSSSPHRSRTCSETIRKPTARFSLR